MHIDQPNFTVEWTPLSVFLKDILELFKIIYNLWTTTSILESLKSLLTLPWFETTAEFNCITLIKPLSGGISCTYVFHKIAVVNISIATSKNVCYRAVTDLKVLHSGCFLKKFLKIFKKFPEVCFWNRQMSLVHGTPC